MTWPTDDDEMSADLDVALQMSARAAERLEDFQTRLLREPWAPAEAAAHVALIRLDVLAAYARLEDARALERRRDQAARVVGIAAFNGRTFAALEDGRAFYWEPSGRGLGHWREIQPVPFTPAWTLARIIGAAPARPLEEDHGGEA